MIDGRERLARLAAGTASMGRSGGGGKPEFAGVELAGLLAGLSEDARNLALYRYCGDGSCRPAIFYAALLRVVDRAGQERWRLPPPEPGADGRLRPAEILRKITAAALIEIVESPVCQDCDGVGYQAGQGVLTPRQCQRCDGTGRYRPTAGAIASALGRSRQQYYEVWQPRYQAVVADLGGWVASLEGDVTAVLRKQMRSA